MQQNLFRHVAGLLGRPGKFQTKNLSVREEWLAATLAEIPSGQRILDAGAGELKYKKFCTHLDYVSQDFGQYDGAGDGVGLQRGTWDQSRLDIVSDIANIPEPNESFDAVMCIEVLEHVPHPVEALRELSRLLKPGGRLIVTTPFCSMTHFAPYFFQTGYSPYFYHHWCKQFGMTVIEIVHNGNYFDYLGQELNRLPIMSKQHSDGSMNILDYGAIYLLLHALNRLSKRNRDSEQLMTYGLNVLARKN